MDDYNGNSNGQPVQAIVEPVGAGDPNKEVMSMTDWLITMIVLAVPCLGIVMYFVWAFGDGNENRKNYCRAGLIITLIVFVLAFVFMAVFGAAIAAMVATYAG